MTPRQIRKAATEIVIKTDKLDMLLNDNLANTVASLCGLIVALTERIDCIEGAMP